MRFDKARHDPLPLMVYQLTVFWQFRGRCNIVLWIIKTVQKASAHGFDRLRHGAPIWFR